MYVRLPRLIFVFHKEAFHHFQKGRPALLLIPLKHMDEGEFAKASRLTHLRIHLEVVLNFVSLVEPL